MTYENIEAVMSRHSNVAIQVSGGRDSVAVLMLMKPWWNQATVYWLDTGDCFPETIEIMQKIEEMVPRFARISSDSKANRVHGGIPSDVVPVDATFFGRISQRSAGPVIQDRNHCCVTSIMAPLHERMIGDGVTLIVRGQRSSDNKKGPYNSGDVTPDGLQLLYPIENWTDEAVTEYVREYGLLAPWYDAGLDGSPDCMGCTAYWGERRGQYLKDHHPAAYNAYQSGLQTIAIACAESIESFNLELGE